MSHYQTCDVPSPNLIGCLANNYKNRERWRPLLRDRGSTHPNTPHPLVTQRHKSYDTPACEAVLMIGIATLSLKPSCEHGQRSNVLPKVLTGFLRGSVCGGKGMFVWLMGVKHSRGHSRQGHGDNIRAVVLIILIVFNGEIPTPPPTIPYIFLASSSPVTTPFF